MRTVNEPVTLLGAFVAGIISFLSPCILPLIPAYVAFVSGKSVEELQEGAGKSRGVFLGSLFFVLGFSTVFVVLGATATGLGQFLVGQLALLTKVAGVVIVVLGLSLAGLFQLPLINRTVRLEVTRKPTGKTGSFLLGAAFAFGWTPCIGPILAGILAFAATQDTVYQGILLLSVYSLGLGIPFLLTTLSLRRFFRWTAPVKRHFRLVEIVSGLLLVVVGILVFTGGLTRIANYLGFFNQFAL